MDLEKKNKRIVRRFYDEGINAHDLKALNEMLADDYIRHSQSDCPGVAEVRDKKIVLTFLKGHFEGFPDWREDISFMVAEGDKVALLTVATANHTGMKGFMNPTGNRINLLHFTIHRIDDAGRIAETWINWDNLSFLTQLGLWPPTRHLEERIQRFLEESST
jgi:predicted SnoaL-like aldol condensation-catalyzing enzyme